MSIRLNDRVVENDGQYGYKKLAWMRILKVILTSHKTKQRLVFGGADQDLDIQVTGYKYMSTLKDNCTIRITNLTYSYMVQIIKDEFYSVEIVCGYEKGNEFTIFKGGVLHVSNALTDTKSNVCIILCASELIARYSQQRLNLSLNSGINMYTALKFVTKAAGIPNANISEQLKLDFIQETMSANDTVGGWLNRIAQDNQNFVTNSDDALGSVVTFYNSDRADTRVIDLNSQTIDLSGGYPRVDTQGITLTVMPTFCFVCGDIIKIDNSILDISISNRSQISKNYARYLDKDGMYTIYEIDYTLENNGQTFSQNLYGKARSLISTVTGLNPY